MFLSANDGAGALFFFGSVAFEESEFNVLSWWWMYYS
jgi:hypothetical protein